MEEPFSTLARGRHRPPDDARQPCPCAGPPRHTPKPAIPEPVDALAHRRGLAADQDAVAPRDDPAPAEGAATEPGAGHGTEQGLEAVEPGRVDFPTDRPDHAGKGAPPDLPRRFGEDT